ncbi:TPA: hypothetical protein ACHTMH_003791 [Pseudomonas aeruginosa]
MLVSEKQYREIKALFKRPSEENSTESPNDLVSLALKNQLQALAKQNGGEVQTSEDMGTTVVVNPANKVSDNINEAFAKTRVQLSAVDSTGQTDDSNTSASDEFNAYMNSGPEGTHRDSIIKDVGLSEKETQAIPLSEKAAQPGE